MPQCTSGIDYAWVITAFGYAGVKSPDLFPLASLARRETGRRKSRCQSSAIWGGSFGRVASPVDKRDLFYVE